MTLTTRDWLLDYAAEEEEKVRHLAGSAHDLDPMRLIRHLYSDRLTSGPGRIHAYQEQGSLVTSTILHRQTVKELFPVADREACESLLGVSIDDLSWLVDEGLVLLVIQHPKQYETLEYLHPLLRSKNRPASYEIRDRVFYDLLAKGAYEDYLREGYALPALAANEKWTEDVREPYENHLAQPADRWVQRNVQRFAALCSLAGRDAVLETLTAGAGGAESVRGRLFDLHRRVLHPVSQGLYGVPHTDVVSALDDDLVGQLEATIVDGVHLHIPSSFSREMVESAQHLGFPQRFECIELEMITRLGNEELQNPSTESQDLAAVFAELDESLQSADHRKIGFIEKTIRVGGIFAGVGAAAVNLWLGAGVAAAAELTPKGTHGGLLRLYQSAFGRRRLPWNYWKAKQIAGKLSPPSRIRPKGKQ